MFIKNFVVDLVSFEQGRFFQQGCALFSTVVCVCVTVIYINPGAHPMSLGTENRGCCRGLLHSEYMVQQAKETKMQV